MPKRPLVEVVSRAMGTVSVAIAFADTTSVTDVFGAAVFVLAAVEGLLPTVSP
jgi:hypothetical protein